MCLKRNLLTLSIATFAAIAISCSHDGGGSDSIPLNVPISSSNNALTIPAISPLIGIWQNASINTEVTFYSTGNNVMWVENNVSDNGHYILNGSNLILKDFSVSSHNKNCTVVISANNIIIDGLTLTRKTSPNGGIGGGTVVPQDPNADYYSRDLLNLDRYYQDGVVATIVQGEDIVECRQDPSDGCYELHLKNSACLGDTFIIKEEYNGQVSYVTYIVKKIFGQ